MPSSPAGVADPIIADAYRWHDAVLGLVISCGSYDGVVTDEIAAAVADTIRSGDRVASVNSLRFTAWLIGIGRGNYLLWRSRMDAILRAHATEVTEAAG